MKRMAMLMGLSFLLMALGSFSPFGARWGGAAVAAADDDNDDDDDGDQGSGDTTSPLPV